MGKNDDRVADLEADIKESEQTLRIYQEYVKTWEAIVENLKSSLEALKNKTDEQA